MWYLVRIVVHCSSNHLCICCKLEHRLENCTSMIMVLCSPSCLLSNILCIYMVIISRLHRQSGGLQFSVYVCVFYQTVWTTNNTGISIELPTDLKLYKDQNKRQAFSKTFCYDNFYNSQLPFHHFQKTSGSKRAQLILFCTAYV